MAIYVYVNTSGVLQSWIPDDLLIADAQAAGILAPSSVLTANGLRPKDSLPPLDATHVWDAPTKTVVVVPAPAPIVPANAFIQLFTDPEFAAVQQAAVVGDPTYNARIAKFNFYLRTVTQVNCGDPFVVGVVGTSMVNQGILTQAEVNRILSGQGY